MSRPGPAVSAWARSCCRIWKTRPAPSDLRLICLETGVYQPEALGLFAHHGFARCRHFGDYPPDDPLSLFMDKRL